MIGFGKYGKRQAEATTITALTDSRLILINPQEDGFFETVLNFKSKNNSINAFIEACREVKEANLESFYRTRVDPSDNGDHKVAFVKGQNSALCHSYNWWVETASKMPTVEGKRWHLATEYQYYAFLVWLINQLVKSGKSVEDAMNQVVLESKELGHYYDSEASMKGEDSEPTGSRCICGVYDLANVYKILACSNQEAGGFWLAGGCYGCNGYFNPLAHLYHVTNVVNDYDDSVGMLVL